MKRATEEFYAALTTDYLTKIRQLVPRYDEMVECILELLELCSPKTVLDIGAGIGNISALVLRGIPGSRVTAVEPSDAMIGKARRLSESSPDRIRLVRQDILDFVPDGRFDAIFSNLVLHNIPLDERGPLLTRLCGWLEPGGCFVWSDLICHADERVQAHFVEYRKAFALAAGCSSELVEENFEKEAREDHPLTIEQMNEEARRAGFRRATPVWIHDTFAILWLRR
ncbi:MAG: hypothetical protein AMS25_02270 [Gemmatimonas sp. SM23_52]|nr:MAG: hypothetical protein AMS25_02270 [Gemmatimonas sp. SM23_52]